MIPPLLLFYIGAHTGHLAIDIKRVDNTEATIIVVGRYLYESLFLGHKLVDTLSTLC